VRWSGQSRAIQRFGAVNRKRRSPVASAARDLPLREPVRSAILPQNQPQSGECRLESKADELKGYTLLKHLYHHLRPIYPDRQTPGRPLGTDECIEHFKGIVTGMQTAAEDMRKNLDAHQQQINSDIENRWSKGKRKLVPGAVLLDEIFKTYGLRFVKLRDGPELAAKLGASDIDLELQAILRGLDSEEQH
jgi:hypothetical protein